MNQFSLTMRRTITATLVCASTTLAGAAQNAGQQPSTPRPVSPSAAATVRPTTTLVGCLYREEQVPGRKPNVAEKAGILEDYILAGASAVGTKESGGASGTPTTGSTYKVEGPRDDELKALVGKRVEVVGSIDPEGGPSASPGGAQPNRGLGPDEVSLPEFEAKSIRAVAGNCPASPERPR